VVSIHSTNLTPDTIVSAPDSYGSPQAAPDSYGSPQAAPDSYGSPQAAPDSYGSPLRSVISSSDTYGSPSNPFLGASDTLGSPIGTTDSYGSPVAASIVVGGQAPDTYGSPVFGTVENVNLGAPDSYGTPRGSPIGSAQAQDAYGSPQVAVPNTYVSPTAPAQDSYGSPLNQGFQPNQNSYGSPLTNLFQAPNLFGSSQFNDNPDPDVSMATIRVVEPPNSNPGPSTNPFIGRANKPYQVPML
jgi:hypothetical protein